MVSKKRLLKLYKVFTNAKLAVWRSFQSSYLKTKYINLPGPACQQKGYDMQKHGQIRALNSKKALKALALVSREYNFSDPNFKVLDTAILLKDSITDLVFV